MNRLVRRLLVSSVALAPVFGVVPAHADIPTDYPGKPYLGTPSGIPGRVELANVDTGGAEISYHADHNRMNSAGYEPISGNDYRPTEKDLPNICKTNEANPDTWALDGTVYPSATDKSWYYIGYAHSVDWVKITVNVAQAGKYNVSSSWASAGPKWGLSIWFNDGHSAVDPKHPKDGVNKSGVVVMDGTADYHKWKAYPNFTTVELSAGVQVMTFHLEQFDHLQYGFLQFDLVGGAGGSGMAGAAGASSAAGAGGATMTGSGGTGGAAEPGGAGSAGVTAGAASGGTAGAPPVGLSTPPAAGASPTPVAAPGSSDQQGGCSFVGRSRMSWPALLGAALVAGVFIRCRRRRMR